SLRPGPLYAVRGAGRYPEGLGPERRVRGRGQDLNRPLLIAEDHGAEATAGQSVRRLSVRRRVLRVRARDPSAQDESSHYPQCSTHSFPPFQMEIPVCRTGPPRYTKQSSQSFHGEAETQVGDVRLKVRFSVVPVETVAQPMHHSSVGASTPTRCGSRTGGR